ncbi:MAG TPA: hypothetical protein VIP77_01420 [Jiangellaceae bacterium]
MTVVEALVRRCTDVSRTLAEAGQHLLVVGRVVDSRNDAAAQDTRGPLGRVLSPTFVAVQPRIHGAGRKIDMAVVTLDTVQRAIKGASEEALLDTILDRLIGSKVSLDELAVDLNSCQGDLDHIAGTLSFRLEDNRVGRSVLDRCERARQALIAARVQFAELLQEQDQLIRDTADEDAAEPALAPRPSGVAAHQAISSVTELMNLGQNLATTLGLAQTCVTRAVEATKDSLAKAREAGFPSVVERWEEIDRDVTGVQREVAAALEGVRTVVTTLEDIPRLDTIDDVRAAFRANEVELTTVLAQLTTASESMTSAGASVPLSRGGRRYSRIREKLHDASTATRTAAAELQRFIDLNFELVMQL